MGLFEGKPEMAPVFERRRGILEPYGRPMHVTANSDAADGIEGARVDQARRFDKRPRIGRR